VITDWLGVAYTVTVAGLSVFGPGQHPAICLSAVGAAHTETLRPAPPSFMSGSAPTVRGGEKGE